MGCRKGEEEREIRLKRQGGQDGEVRIGSAKAFGSSWCNGELRSS